MLRDNALWFLIMMPVHSVYKRRLYSDVCILNATYDPKNAIVIQRYVCEQILVHGENQLELNEAVRRHLSVMIQCIFTFVVQCIFVNVL